MHVMDNKKTAPKTIITSHVNADFDALASMVAVKKLYPDAAIIVPPYREKNGVNYFLDSISYIFNFRQPKDCDLSQAKLLVVVDTRQRGRIKHVAEVLDNPGLEIHLYDHHPDSEDDLKADYAVVKALGSTTTIIGQILKEKHLNPMPDEATMMGLGLYDDTGSFTFSSTTEDDLLIGAWLRRHMMDLSIVSDLVNSSLTSQQVLLLNRMIESAVTHEVHGISILVTEIVLDEYVDDFSVLTHQMMDMENAKIVLALAQMGDRVQVVARSRVPEKVDVGKICASLGGGGHSYAAAASIKDKTLAEVKAELFAMLFSTINEEITVGTRMTSPAKAVEDSDSLAKAEAVMLRYGLKAVPVVAQGTRRCLGYLEYQTAARALGHKLGDLQVADYMHAKARTLNVDSSLYAAMEIILSQRQRLVPVVDEDENLVGVLTRTDIMRLLLDESIRLPEGTPMTTQQKDRNVKALMCGKLPDIYYNLLQTVGDLGDRLGVQVYAVGGFVRDILMDRVNLDMDVTVEGDGIAFARSLADLLGGRMRSHPKFKTALVIFTDGEGVEQRIDVATARLEYYEHPGALPTVELSSIKMDLARRDFTINALAIRLNGANFGDLVDPFGAQRDMKEKTVRVLHSLSFVEDPTRVLRGIRFEKRFGFKIDAQTEKLVKNCLQLGFMRNLSGARLMNELRHIFDEKSPLLCIERMESLGVLADVHPQLKLTPHKAEILASIEEVLSWYKLLFLREEPQNWALYLMGLSHGLKYKEMLSVLERLMFTERGKNDFMSMRESMRHASKELAAWQKTEDEKSMRELYKILVKLPLESVLYIMSLGNFQDIKKELSHFLSRLWHMKLDITGDDIMQMGAERGPAIGIILRRIMEAKADGKADTKDEQLELARRFLLESELVSIERLSPGDIGSSGKY